MLISHDGVGPSRLSSNRYLQESQIKYDAHTLTLQYSVKGCVFTVFVVFFRPFLSMQQQLSL